MPTRRFGRTGREAGGLGVGCHRGDPVAEAFPPDHVREHAELSPASFGLAGCDAGPLDAGLLETLRAHRRDRVPTEWSQ